MIVIMVMIVCACRYESTTKIHRKLVKELDFPAISLCSPTIVAESTLSTDSESQDWLRRIQQGSLTAEEFPEARSALRRHNALHALSAHLPPLVENCWISIHGLCGHLFSTVMSDRGICYTFHSRDIIEQYGQLKTDRPGVNYGLSK